MDDEAIDRALRVWREEADVAYSARIRDYILPDDSGVDRVALAAADGEAERLNRDLMRRAIEAALGAQHE
jgi:hypothetical protein